MNYTSSIKKSLKLLKALAEGTGGGGVRLLAKETEMAPSTVHRILQELVDCSFAQVNDGIYSLGPEFYYLTYVVNKHNPLYVQAMPFITKLAEECGETVALGQYFSHSNSLTFIATVESIHPIRHVLNVGMQEVLYAGATGKAVLAFLPAAVQEKVLKSCIKKTNVKGIPFDPETIKQDLNEIVRLGYAITHQEIIDAAYGFAAPIFGPEDDVLGTVGVTIPDSRVDTLKMQDIAKKVLSCTQKISQSLRSRKDGYLSSERGGAAATGF